MKRIFPVVLFSAAMGVVFAQDSWKIAAETRADSIRAKFLDPDDREVLVAVHRGDWRNYAENSLEGIENAVRMGADIVEIDLRRTADGELVLMHDPKIDRTTTGKGLVSDMTLAELRKLRLRNGVMGRTPYRIPTLREVMLAQKGRVLVNLDKAFDYFDQVMEILDETGTAAQVIMKGSAPADEVRKRYGCHLDKVLYMPVVNIDVDDAVEKVRDYLDVLDPPAIELVFADSCNMVAPEIGRLCKGRTRVWYNSLWSSLAGGHDDFASLIDPDRGFAYLVDSLGCSIIQTDQPRFLTGWLSDRGVKRWQPAAADMKRFRRMARREQREADWAQFSRYRDANSRLTKAPAVVFMGNSITDGWAKKRPEFFNCRNMVGRGISGQTTSQMLVRFRADVIELKPKAVVILAGINDIACNNGVISLEDIAGNIKSMCEIARAAGIKPILCSILPASRFSWAPELAPAGDVKRLNSILKAYAEDNSIDFVDYYSTMVDNEGGFDSRFTRDGVHPTEAGYEVMEQIIQSFISAYVD